MMKFTALLKELEKLKIPQTRMVLLGSAALAIRGMRDVNHLDVLVAPEELERLRPQAKGIDEGKLVFVVDEGIITVSDHLINFAVEIGLTEEEIWSSAATWKNRWQIISLELLEKFKIIVRREKDLRDLALIEKWRQGTATKLSMV